jgi:pimeloyl-ACP methyl ester carboxylesterase
MGLGSPVALLATEHLAQIRRLGMIDSASGARAAAAGEQRESAAGANVREFTGGPPTFGSFDEIVERTVRYNAGRSERSLRRGVRHNAKQQPDGTWTWRWDPRNRSDRDFAFEALEQALDTFEGPVLLVRGATSDVVTDDTVDAFRQRHHDTTLVTVEGAGHGVQGDRPIEVAATLSWFALQ